MLAYQRGLATWHSHTYPRGRFPFMTGGYRNIDIDLVRVGGHQTEIEVDSHILIGSHQQINPNRYPYKSPDMFHLGKDSGRFYLDRSRPGYCISQYLNDEGALIVTVVIQIYGGQPAWYPEPEMEKPSHSPDLSLVKLVAAGTEFPLCRSILKQKAPALLDLYTNPAEAVEINDVEKNIFESFVRYLNSNAIPSMDSYEDAKTYLLLANRFSSTQLKLYAESTIVDKYLEPANAAELALISHSHSCALLKESAMKLCAKNPETLVGTDMSESAELMIELCILCTGKTKPEAAHCGNPERMPVADLRDECQKRKLDVDGTRETLIKRLKSDDTTKTTATTTTA